jgi:uncharacterized protein (TIGR02246 family)
MGGMRTWCVGALLLAVAPVAGAGGESALSERERASIERAVLETDARVTQAARDRDVDRLFSFMAETEKGSVIQNGALLLTKAEAKVRVQGNMRGISALDYRWKQQHVTVVSPTVAILVAEGESAVTTDQGQTFTAPFVQTTVYVQRDGRWLIQHAHQSAPPRR